MATWDIDVPAGSGVGSGGDTSSAVSPTVPGDFDGATIDSVLIVGSPTVTADSDPTVDDGCDFWWYIATSTGTAVYGGNSVSTGICDANFPQSSTSFALINNTASPSPAPTTAVSADWDNIHVGVGYSANMMDDGELFSWSTFKIRVTYTPGAGTINNRTLQDLDSVAATDPTDVKLRQRERVQSDELAADYSLETIRKRTISILNNVVEDNITDAIVATVSKAPISVVDTSNPIVVPDSIIELRKRWRELADAFAAGDDTAIQRERFRTLADSIEVEDAAIATKVSAKFVVVLDTIESTEAIITLRERQRGLSDSITVADSEALARELNRVQSDTLSAQDADDFFKLASRQLSDSIAVTDSAVRFRQRTKSQADSLATTDFSIELRLRDRGQSDSLVALDDKTATYVPAGLVVNNVTLSDYIQNVSDALIIPNVFSYAVRFRNREQTDTSAVVDFDVELRLRDRGQSDSLAALDDATVTYTPSGNVTTRTLSDSAAVVDSSTELRDRLRESTDSLEANDAASASAIRVRKTTDNFDLSDATDQLIQKSRTLFDSADIADSVFPTYIPEGIIIRTRTLTDSLSVSDFVSATRVDQLADFAIRHGIDQLNVKHGVENLHILHKVKQEV